MSAADIRLEGAPESEGPAPSQLISLMATVCC